MAEGAPDWTKAVKIYGVDEHGNVVGVLLDAAGKMEALIKGWDSEDFHTLLTDEDGRLICVLRDPTNNRYMAINAAGQIVAVMIGQHASGPKPIATDDEGRMLAIVIDPENIWGERAVVGNAELAARLGSPVNYERRGTVIFADNFEQGFSHCALGFVPGDGAIDLVADNTLIGGYSAYLTSGITGDDESVLEYETAPPQFDKPVGIETHWARGEGLSEIELKIILTTRTSLGFASVMINPTTGVVSYSKLGGGYAELDTRHAFNDFSHSWHAVKVVVDPVTFNYLRIYIDETEYTEFDHEYAHNLEENDPRIGAYIEVRGNGVVNGYAWVDSLIITTNEPVT